MADEFLIINIGSGVQEGGTVTIVGVTETLDAAKHLVQGIKGTSPGKILIAEKKSVITRTPVVELKETDESVLVRRR